MPFPFTCEHFSQWSFEQLLWRDSQPLHAPANSHLFLDSFPSRVWIWLILTSFRVHSIFCWVWGQSPLFEILYWRLSAFLPGVRLYPILQLTFLRSQKERRRTFCTHHSYLLCPSPPHTHISRKIQPPELTQSSSISKFFKMIWFQIPLPKVGWAWPCHLLSISEYQSSSFSTWSSFHHHAGWIPLTAFTTPQPDHCSRNRAVSCLGSRWWAGQEHSLGLNHS